MLATIVKRRLVLKQEQLFVLSSFVVNGGNYLYNLVLGRVLGPEAFADAAVLITLLLTLSFVAMTFQITVAKFTIELDGFKKVKFKSWARKNAVLIGSVIGVITVLFSDWLQQVFNTETTAMFTIFGVGIPLYFIMSVNRGILQGSNNFIGLSGSYQFEMWSRLLLSLLFIIGFAVSPSVAVASGIFVSFIAGVFPMARLKSTDKTNINFSPQEKKQIRNFFILTACYECTQIICNNSDILLVKHYFDSYNAGLYASLALIGRVVYFVTWMIVMLLLPKVIAKKKMGENTEPILIQYTVYVSAISLVIVLGAFLFPNIAVQLLFGEAYLSIAPLLGWYALATSLFAMSNIFAYYFLSLNVYVPVIISGIMGILQILLIYFFHENLSEVVVMQIIAMALLLLSQLAYFFFRR